MQCGVTPLLAWAWVMARPRPTVQRLFFRQADSRLTPFLRCAARAAIRVVPPLPPPSFKLAHGWGRLACGISSWRLSRNLSQQFSVFDSAVVLSPASSLSSSTLASGHFLAAAHGGVTPLLAWAWVMASLGLQISASS